MKQKMITGAFCHSQRGVALVTALVLLVILTMLGLSAMRTNVLEERMAANSQEITRAFQSAESGLEMAFDDADSFSVNNTVDNPGVGGDADFAGQGIDLVYEAVFLQTTPPRRGSGWDSSFAFYHFNLSSNATTVSGAVSRLHAGAYQVGKQ